MKCYPLDKYPVAEADLTKAKMTLMTQSNTVFYTTILFSLKQSFSEDIFAAATDGLELILNPTFFHDLTKNERIGLLLHEVMHVALDHMSRLGNRDKETWNIAGDYVINLSLTEAGYELPASRLLDYDYKNMSTEDIYKVIYVPCNKQKQANIAYANCSMKSDILPSSEAGDATAQTEKEEAITEIIMRAAMQADIGLNPGNVPGEILIALQKKINPKLPWNEILMNYLTEASKDDYTLRRPNKRFLPKHYLPTAYSEAIPNIAVAVDASCSVSDNEFGYFITEIDRIQRELQPQKITVITFDTKIQKVQELSCEQDIFKELKFTGRGGTRIAPVLKWAKDNEPTLMIIFSDGEFSMPDIVPNMPIIWIIHDDLKWSAPFGQVINYNMEY